MKRYYKHGYDKTIKYWYQTKVYKQLYSNNYNKHYHCIKKILNKYNIYKFNIKYKYNKYDNINNIIEHYPGYITIYDNNISNKKLNKLKQLFDNNWYILTKN